MSYFLYQPHVYAGGVVTTPDFMLAGAEVIGGQGVRSTTLDRAGIGCATDLGSGADVAAAIGVLVGQSGPLVFPVLVRVGPSKTTPEAALFSRVALRLAPSGASTASKLRVTHAAAARDHALWPAVQEILASLSDVPSPRTGVLVLDEPRPLNGEIRMEIVGADTALPPFVIRGIPAGPGAAVRPAAHG